MGLVERPGPSVTLDEAQRLVLDACSPLDPVDVPIDEALGRVLAGPVVAAADVPRFANSAMDGYALRAVDTTGVPVTLSVVGAALAGIRSPARSSPARRW